MVGHETVAMAEPVGILYNRLQEIEKSLSVEVIPENGMARIAAGSYVVKGTCVLNSQRSSHSGTFMSTLVKCQKTRPDPIGHLRVLTLFTVMFISFIKAGEDSL
jgi:hypothetical protein